MYGQRRSRHKLTSGELKNILARLKEFDFHGKKIRAIWDDSQYWIVLPDILNALGYKVKASHIAKSLLPQEIGHKDIGAKGSLVNCVTKSGLYAVTRFSEKPSAQEFYAWCLEEIYSENFIMSEIVLLFNGLSKEEQREVLSQLEEIQANGAPSRSMEAR